MAVTDKSPEKVAPPTAPIARITNRAWWRRNLAPEERRRVMEELAMGRVNQSTWAWRFTIMLTLAVVVAVMGLSANSAAVVIGAMLLAPLMTPVLATAACLSMSLIKRSLISLAKVALATAWCVLIAYLLSRILPDSPLSSEVEARTRPDIRDLVVALAAGAAGSYATVRKDASAALPGVAVAVALVPPLATVGITLEAGKTDLAAGALLLYVTNLAAIVFAGVMVFIATGFVPPRRLANTAARLLVAAAIALVVVVAVAVPLYGRSAEVVAAVQDEVAAKRIVEEWLNGIDLSPQVDVTGNRVLVDLRGFEAPPDDGPLTAAMKAELGEEVTVLVQWTRTERATTTTTAPLSDADAFVLQIGPIVDEWLAAADPEAGYEVDDITFNGEVVTIDVAGTGSPPSVDELVTMFETELGRALPVRLNWTPQEVITPTGTVPPVELVAQRMEARVREWAGERAMAVESFDYNGTRVRVELIGPEEPDINAIVVELQAMAAEAPEGDAETPVQVFLTRQELVTTTTLPIIDPFGGSLQTVVGSTDDDAGTGESEPLAPTATTTRGTPTASVTRG